MSRLLAPWLRPLANPTRLLKTVLLLALAMLVFEGVRLALLVTYPDQFSSLGGGDKVSAFLQGLRFDMSIFLTFAAYPLWLLNLPPFSWRLGRLILGWMVFAILIAAFMLMSGDLLYFGEVNRHLTNELTLLGNDAGFLVDMAFGAYLPILLGWLLLVGGLGWLWHKMLNLPERPNRYPWLTFALLFFLLFSGIRQTATGKPIGTIDAFQNGSLAYGNLALNAPFTAYWTWYEGGLVEMKDAFPTQEALKLAGLGSADYPYEQHFDSHPNNLNIVYVLLESWGSRYVDGFKGSFGVTPNLKRLADGGLRFTHFRASGQRSIQGIQATLTGIPYLPGMKNLGFGLELANFTRLGALAQEHGYETIFVQTSPRRSFHIDGVASATGFGEYYGREDIPLLLNYPDPDASKFGWDYDTLMFLKKRLDRAQKPFIAYLFTGTTHPPFADPGKQWHPYPLDANGIGGLLDTLNYSDWSIGQFMEAASKEPWFDNTVFFFSADHDLPHFASKPTRFTDNFEIPLVVYSPKHIPPGEDQRLSSQLDVLPTFMDLLGFGDTFAATGQSLLRPPSTKPEAWFCDGGPVSGLMTSTGSVVFVGDRILETGATPSQTMSPQKVEALKNEAEAKLQIIRDAIDRNRWVH